MAKKLTHKKLLELAKRYKELSAEEAKIGKEKDEIKEILKKEMKNRDLEELLIDAYKIIYSKYESTKFDSKAFQEKHKKLYEKFTYTTQSEKLLVNLGK